MIRPRAPERGKDKDEDAAYAKLSGALEVKNLTFGYSRLAEPIVKDFNLTLETGKVHYWSRSRNKLWKKGESSGNMQQLVEMRVDCDLDAVVVRAEQSGPACHEGYKSCFFRTVDTDGALVVNAEQLMTPEQMYGSSK